MKVRVALTLAVLLSSCAQIDRAMFGAYAMTLAEKPTPSECAQENEICKRLDAFEAEGYALARSNKTTWLQLVDGFYQLQDQLMPNARGKSDAFVEYQAFQRMLAEKMDKKQISEIEWAYLLKNKSNELSERAQVVSNSQSAASSAASAAVNAANAAGAAQRAANNTMH